MLRDPWGSLPEGKEVVHLRKGGHEPVVSCVYTVITNVVIRVSIGTTFYLELRMKCVFINDWPGTQVLAFVK